jgi:hypothetical protein
MGCHQGRTAASLQFSALNSRSLISVNQLAELPSPSRPLGWSLEVGKVALISSEPILELTIKRH